MKHLIAAALLCGASLHVSPSLAAMSEADCEAAWTRLDADKNGTVSESEGGRYYAKLRVANKPVEAGKLDRATFLNHCKVGLFDVDKIDPGAPLKGANSFTEGQAKDRAIAHGVTNVSAMTKDADGIWRGKGSVDGKSVDVAVDYKGNVVAK